MSIRLLIGILIIMGCKEPQLQSIAYKEAIEGCKYKREQIKKKYPNNELIRVRPDCLIGAQLPDVKIKGMEGKIITTEFLKGKKNIINFWFITCPPCIKEMPWLNKIQSELGEEKINYIAISRDSKKDTEEFLEETAFNFTIIPDGRTLIEDNFDHMWGYPFTIITDENLIIKHISQGKPTEEELRSELLPFLKD